MTEALPLKPHRVYHNPAYLLKIYNWIKEYKETHGFYPSNIELVAAGFAASSSVIRYYFSRMEEMKMIIIPSMKIGKRTCTPARSFLMLDLKDAHPAVAKLAESETTNINPNKDTNHEQQ